MIGGFVVLGDFSQRVHLLLLLAAVGTYTIVLLGLLALAAHVSRSTQRVLQAIALLADAGGHGDPR